MTESWEEQPQKRPTFQWLCSAVKRLLDDKKVCKVLTVFFNYNNEGKFPFDLSCQVFAWCTEFFSLSHYSLQCALSNHERYGFIFTLFLLYFHLFCSL